MDVDSLLRAVVSLGLFETREGILEKVNSVKVLERVGTEWVLKTAPIVGFSGVFDEEHLPCRVLIQGSTALGVSAHKSDVDAVLVVPNFMDRDDFFSTFIECLRRTPTLSDIVAVPDTFVPVIRLHISRIPVDLVLSCLGSSFVPKNLDFSQAPERLYSQMDPFSVRSLSGPHLAMTLLKMTADCPQFTPFLRVIRAWIDARAINTFVYGFPSSIAWTIMAVHIVKRPDGQNPAQRAGFCVCHHFNRPQPINAQHCLPCLVHMFFARFSRWPWPSPVQLAPIQVVPSLSTSSWNPQKFSQDERDLMPIITPVFPNKNTAYSVRLATRQIVIDELERGHQIVSQILQGRAHWSELFTKYDVRDHYRHFVLLTLQSPSKQEFNITKGLVDSRLRDLAQSLEDERPINSVRISPVRQSGVCNENANPTVFTHQWLIALDIQPAPLQTDGTRATVAVDITGRLFDFYQILRERDGCTDFRKILSHKYLQRPQTMNFAL